MCTNVSPESKWYDALSPENENGSPEHIASPPTPGVASEDQTPPPSPLKRRRKDSPDDGPNSEGLTLKRKKREDSSSSSSSDENETAPPPIPRRLRAKGMKPSQNTIFFGAIDRVVVDGGLDTNVLVENIPIPTSISHAVLRILTWCAQEKTRRDPCVQSSIRFTQL